MIVQIKFFKEFGRRQHIVRQRTHANLAEKFNQTHWHTTMQHVSSYGLKWPKTSGEHAHTDVDGERIAFFVVTCFDQIARRSRFVLLSQQHHRAGQPRQQQRQHGLLVIDARFSRIASTARWFPPTHECRWTCLRVSMWIESRTRVSTLTTFVAPHRPTPIAKHTQN